MNRIKKDEDRENRIYDEAIVDAYGPEEQSMGWYYYVDDKCSFPFKARCVQEKRISPLKLGEEVTVTGLAPEEDCESGLFALIDWMDRRFGVPLEQLEGVKVDEDTAEAIGDWHYWVARGYSWI